MNNSGKDITLKPSPIFAFLKITPFMFIALTATWLAYHLAPSFIYLSILLLLFMLYRYIYIRRAIYLVTPEYIRISTGIFIKRIDTVELFRVKDYVITEPLLMQLFKLMDLQLKTTDPENPVLWLRGIPQTDIIDILRHRVLETRKHNQIVEIN
jgi:uncharacterized membrane protein YdbT with pleckstrin-like domain